MLELEERRDDEGRTASMTLLRVNGMVIGGVVGKRLEVRVRGGVELAGLLGGHRLVSYYFIGMNMPPDVGKPRWKIHGGLGVRSRTPWHRVDTN
jgi:hypothetical protein